MTRPFGTKLKRMEFSLGHLSAASRRDKRKYLAQFVSSRESKGLLSHLDFIVRRVQVSLAQTSRVLHLTLSPLSP